MIFQQQIFSTLSFKRSYDKKETSMTHIFWRQKIFILSTLCWLTSRFQNQRLVKKFCSGRSGSRSPFPIVFSKFHQRFCSGVPQISLFVHILHSIFTKRQINLPMQCLHEIQIFTGLNFKALSKNSMYNLNEQESDCRILKAKPSCYCLNVVFEQSQGRCNAHIASLVFRRTSVIFKENEICLIFFLYVLVLYYVVLILAIPAKNKGLKQIFFSDTLDGLFLGGHAPSTAPFL